MEKIKQNLVQFGMTGRVRRYRMVYLVHIIPYRLPDARVLVSGVPCNNLTARCPNVEANECCSFGLKLPALSVTVQRSTKSMERELPLTRRPGEFSIQSGKPMQRLDDSGGDGSSTLLSAHTVPDE